MFRKVISIQEEENRGNVNSANYDFSSPQSTTVLSTAKQNIILNYEGVIPRHAHVSKVIHCSIVYEGEVVSIVGKCAVTKEQIKRLAQEYKTYIQLTQQNFPNIPAVYGHYQSKDARILLLENIGAGVTTKSLVELNSLSKGIR